MPLAFTRSISTLGKAVQTRVKLILHLVPRGRKIKEASTREVVEGPKRGDGKHCAGFAGEVGASGRGLVTSFVVQENLALPIVRTNTED